MKDVTVPIVNSRHATAQRSSLMDSSEDIAKDSAPFLCDQTVLYQRRTVLYFYVVPQ
jgi:hypothetical protein